MIFSAILVQQPNGQWAKVAAMYDPATGIYTPIYVGATFVPTAFDSAATDTTGEFVEITFDGQLSEEPVPEISDFEVTVNATPVDITAVAISGAVVTLTLDTPVANGETVLVSYSGTALLGLNGMSVPTFSGESVTNNVP